MGDSRESIELVSFCSSKNKNRLQKNWFQHRLYKGIKEGLPTIWYSVIPKYAQSCLFVDILRSINPLIRDGFFVKIFFVDIQNTL